MNEKSFSDSMAPANPAPTSLRSPSDFLQLQRRPGTRCTVAVLKDFLARRKSITNIVLLGLGFMFSMGSYSTCAMASTVILNNIQDEYFTGTSTIGYSVLCVVYGCTAISFLIAPSLTSVLGPKIALVTGAVFQLLYVVTFIRPLVFTLYLGAICQGIGQGLIWTVYGLLLSTNSTKKTIGRNTGIFWCLFVSNLVSGNLFYFFMLRGVEKLLESTRIFIFAVFILCAGLGIFTLSLIQHPWLPNKKSYSLDSETNHKTSHHGPMDALGLDLSFFMNVYGTAIGYTSQFGDIQDALVGLNGVFLGIGQIVGGLLFASLGRCAARRGRDPAIIVGMLTHLVAYFLIFLNIPGDATLAVTNQMAYIGRPSAPLAMICSALLGFGDAAWINQLCALLGTLFKDESISAFACFQFMQCATASAVFFYSAYITMPFHILINVTFAILGAGGFCIVEWSAASNDRHMARISNVISLEEKNILLTGRHKESEPNRASFSCAGDLSDIPMGPRTRFSIIVPPSLSDLS